MVLQRAGRGGALVDAALPRGGVAGGAAGDGGQVGVSPLHRVGDGDGGHQVPGQPPGRGHGPEERAAGGAPPLPHLGGRAGESLMQRS